MDINDSPVDGYVCVPECSVVLSKSFLELSWLLHVPKYSYVLLLAWADMARGFWYIGDIFFLALNLQLVPFTSKAYLECISRPD